MEITTTGDGRLSLLLHDGEPAFLTDMVAMLEGVGRAEGDPGEERLNVPAYLGDAAAADEWRRLMTEQIEEGRANDRRELLEILESQGTAVVDGEKAEAILRVVNEARLVLAARLGVEVESDFENLDLGGALALNYLGMIVEDLSDWLAERL